MDSTYIENNILQLPPDIRPQIDDEEYLYLEPYISSIATVSRVTYKTLYIIDYNRMNFLYVSNNPLFLCGLDAELVKQKGCNFYHEHLPKIDLEFLFQVKKAGFQFFRNLPLSERTQCTISYNFHIIHKESNEKILINHQITPFKLDAQGNMWLALCAVSLAPKDEIGVAYITTLSSNRVWRFTIESKIWTPIERISLNAQEKAVIRLANEGLSICEIARSINRSEDSIKSYRRSIFQKLNVTNISEAIAIATLRKQI